MVLGVGVDIIKVERFFSWVENYSLAQRFFVKDEIEYIYSKGKNAPLSFASHFAAKEAYGKALGRGLKGMALRDISVLECGGKPHLVLSGNARIFFESCGASFAHLSLSHERDNAIALVVLEK